MRSPDYERNGIQLYCGDCLEILSQFEPGSLDAVITDPPYGAGKAEWDKEFPTKWYEFTREMAITHFIMPGIVGLPYCIKMIGNDYQDILVLWLSNGMTRGTITFGNWISVVVAQKVKKYLGNQNVLKIVIDASEKIDHPCPKPMQAMEKLIEIHTKENSIILDPFAGSGTTGVSCVKLGRKFIGIEIEPKYFDIAVKRIEKAFDDQALFVEAEKVEQLSLL